MDQLELEFYILDFIEEHMPGVPVKCIQSRQMPQTANAYGAYYAEQDMFVFNMDNIMADIDRARTLGLKGMMFIDFIMAHEMGHRIDRPFILQTRDMCDTGITVGDYEYRIYAHEYHAWSYGRRFINTNLQRAFWLFNKSNLDNMGGNTNEQTA